MFTAAQLRLFQILCLQAAEDGVDVYLVGGPVRDALLGSPVADLDFLVEGRAVVEFASACNRHLRGQLKVFERFLTCKIVRPADFPSCSAIDFACARTELYEKPGSLPRVKPAAHVQDDLMRRDFSVNAMALKVSDVLRLNAGQAPERGAVQKLILDPFSGMADLDKRLVRVLHCRSFIDDPTRIFRACRYSARLAGRLEDDTAQLFEEALSGGALKTVSATRILNEVKKVCLEDRPADAIALLYSAGVLQAAGFMPPETDFHSVVQGLSALPELKEQSMLFETLLALCFSTFDNHGAAEFISRFGLGIKKKEFYRRSLAGVSRGEFVPDLASDHELLLRFCLTAQSEERNLILAEAARRGLCAAKGAE